MPIPKNNAASLSVPNLPLGVITALAELWFEPDKPPFFLGSLRTIGGEENKKQAYFLVGDCVQNSLSVSLSKYTHTQTHTRTHTPLQ